MKGLIPHNRFSQKQIFEESPIGRSNKMIEIKEILWRFSRENDALWHKVILNIYGLNSNG